MGRLKIHLYSTRKPSEEWKQESPSSRKLIREKLINREKKRVTIRVIADGCTLEKCKVIRKRGSMKREKKRDRFESFDGPCCCCRVAFLFESRYCRNFVHLDSITKETQCSDYVYECS